MFFTGIETSSKDYKEGAIIAVSLYVVNVSSWHIIDTWDHKIQFRLDRADKEWLRENTTYSEHSWEHAMRPQDAVMNMNEFLGQYTTRKKTSAAGKEYATWPICSWDARLDVMWLSNWFKRLSMSFAPFDWESPSIKHRMPWYFMENQHIDHQDMKSLEAVAKYFAIKYQHIDGVIDANNRANIAFLAAKEIFGVST